MLDVLLLNYGCFSDDDLIEFFVCFDGLCFMFECEEMCGFWNDYFGFDGDCDFLCVMLLKVELWGLFCVCFVVFECDVLCDSSFVFVVRL